MKQLVLVYAMLAALSAASPLQSQSTMLRTYSEKEMDDWFASMNMTYPPQWQSIHNRKPPNSTVVEGTDIRHQKRQNQIEWGSVCYESTDRVGDGDPHQNYYHTQVTQTMNCGRGGSCTTSEMITHTIGYSINLGATLFEWIDGGFSVLEYWTTLTTGLATPTKARTCVSG